MNEVGSTSQADTTKALIIVWIAIAAVGATIGFLQGVYGDDGSMARGIEWAWKLAIALSIAAIVPAVLSPLLRRLRAHELAHWIVVMTGAFVAFRVGAALVQGEPSIMDACLNGLGHGVVTGFAMSWVIPRIAHLRPALPARNEESSNARPTDQ